MAAMLAPSAASAHPHVYVDGAIAFEIDAQGRLAALAVEWRFEPFYTVLILEELGLAPDAPLDAAAVAALAQMQRDWAADFGGDGALTLGGVAAPLAAVEAVTAALADGALTIAFRRPLAQPLDPRGARVEAALYDPLFFVAYALAGPMVAGPGADGCVAVLNPFNPFGQAAEMLGALSLLGPDETPDDPGVGAMFADRAVLRCA